MGLYQLILSVYVLISSFATSGLTTAVTRLCTDQLALNNTRSVKKTLWTAVFLSLLIGVISGICVCFGAEWIAQTCLHDIRAVSSLRIMTVSLPFMGISSCIKGYFMARRKVTGSSVAQILEQLTRIGVIVYILEILQADTVEQTCFAILLGDSVAEGISCMYMAVCYWLDRRHLNRANTAKPFIGIRTKLLAIALPITGGRYLNSGLRTIENLTVPNALQIHTLSRETALSQFGKLKGMALPLIFFPSSFLTAFSALLIPEISEANALSQPNRLKRTIERSLHMTLISSYFISGVLFVLAYPLGNILYHDNEVGFMIALLAPLAPIMYTESVIVSILKGLDQQTHSLYYSIVDSITRIICIFLIVPTNGIVGFYVVMVISNLLTCSLNFSRLYKVSSIQVQVSKWIAKPLLALSLALTVVYSLNRTTAFNDNDNALYCVTITVIMIAVYLGALYSLGCIEREDFIQSVPFPRSRK